MAYCNHGDPGIRFLESVRYGPISRGSEGEHTYAHQVLCLASSILAWPP
jgi:hypothetical protein